MTYLDTPRKDQGMNQSDIDREIDRWVEVFNAGTVMRNHYEDLKALEQDWYKFNSMCYEHKVLANSLAYKLYGMKNEEIYYKFRHYFLTHEDIKDQRDNLTYDASLKEDFTLDQNIEDDYSNKDQQAMQTTRKTGYYIILDKNSSPDDLNNQLYKFRSMDHDKKVKADTFSLSIYGKKNEDRYAEMMPKLLAAQDVEDPDYSNMSYDPLQEEVKLESSPKNSLIQQYEYIREQLVMNEINFTDCAILLESVKDIKPVTALEDWYRSFLLESIEKKLQEDTSKILGHLRGYTPPLLIEEMENLGVFSGENNFFGPGKDNTPTDWFASYQAQSIGLKPKQNICGYKWQNRIRFLANGLQTDNQTKQEMLELGYNPEIPYTDDILTESTKRNNRIFEENVGYDFINLMEITEWMPFTAPTESVGQGLFVIFASAKDLEPLPPEMPRVFVAFDSSLSKMYSLTNGQFGAKYNIESLPMKDKINIKLYFLAFTPELSEKVNRMIDYYTNHGFDYRFKYSFISGICSKLKCAHPDTANEKRFCIYLMNMILSIVNMDYRNPGNYMILPTIANLRGDPADKDHIYELYFGSPLQYNQNQISNVLAFHIDYEPINEAMKCLIPYTRIIPIRESKVSLVPQLDKDANILMQNQNNMNFGNEVQICIRYLEQYSKITNSEAMKYYLARLWYLNLLLEFHLNHPKEAEKAYLDKYYDMQLYILKNFEKYSKKISKHDPKFNFTEYYNNLPFSKNVITASSRQQRKLENTIIDMLSNAIKSVGGSFLVQALTKNLSNSKLPSVSNLRSNDSHLGQNVTAPVSPPTPPPNPPRIEVMHFDNPIHNKFD